MIAQSRARARHPSSRDDVIQLISAVNAPRSAPGGSRGRHRLPTTMKRSPSWSAARCRDAAAAFNEEAARTRRYWEKFAREAARELLKDAIKPEGDDGRQRVLYSGRVGIEPRYPPDIPDDGSTSTKLSLLTCSDLLGGGPGRPDPSRRRRVRRRNLDPDADGRTNWGEAVKDSYGGVLGRMLEKDAGTLQAFTNGASAYSVLNKANMSKLFSEEEQALLMRSAFLRGIGSGEKSSSTENVADAGERGTPAVIPDQYAPSSATRRPTADFGGRKIARSRSVPEGPLGVGRRGKPAGGRPPRSIFGPDEAYSGRPPAPSAERRDPDGEYSRRMHARIHSTVTALDRIAGFGDGTGELRPIAAERRCYTRADYARMPRYPQNVRVAPQLADVITSEVRRHVSRPRHFELRQRDVHRFDRTQPILDRASRNLFIFNWLGQLDERDFRRSPFPAARPGADGGAVTRLVSAGDDRSLSTEADDDSDVDVGEPDDDGVDDDCDVDSNDPAVGSLCEQLL